MPATSPAETPAGVHRPTRLPKIPLKRQSRPFVAELALTLVACTQLRQGLFCYPFNEESEE
jgi:hypothetical protein